MNNAEGKGDDKGEEEEKEEKANARMHATIIVRMRGTTALWHPKTHFEIG